MFDLFSTIPLLLVVNAYLVLTLVLLGLSANELVCHLKKGTRCTKRHRRIKSVVAIPLMLSSLGILAFGLFAIGVSHGGKPEGYQVVLFILACLLLVVLLIIWIVGSLWLDTLWVTLITAMIGYLLLFNPAIYVQYWAETNVQWAQMWMAQNYATGRGGLTQSDSTARRWYEQAALNGNSEAQFKMASLARRNKEAVKWYLLAAEQGHVSAMVQMARLGRSDAERQRWLKLAGDKNHPEALFMQAQNAMKSDLPQARRLILDAAENGSRTAMIFLITQYRQGGVLFDQDEAAAKRWSTILDKTPVSPVEPASLNTIRIEQSKIQPQAPANIDTLYKQAQSFLRHPARDQVLYDRAVNYLTRAANQGHSEAALELAKLATQTGASSQINAEAIKWYELAAKKNNEKALKILARYYKAQDNADAVDLEKSLEYNRRLLEFLQSSKNTKQRLTQEHWAGEYRDTQKRLARMERLGGSWETAKNQAEESPDKEYLLAKELLDSRQYEAGMQHLKSAAKRGNPQARFEVASKTLRGPRSFSEEIDAISELQALDRRGMLTASIRLGALYQSGTGVVPRNYYLARQLFRKAQADSQLSERVSRMLKRGPDFTDSLQIQSTDKAGEQIEAWYQQTLAQVQDKDLLRQQYETLLEHFRDIDNLKRQAEANSASAQYQLAQVLQSQDLKQAMIWLKRAAENGGRNAQYELAVRMIRGKKNTPEQQQELKRWAITAADNGHVGALVFLATQYKTGYGGFAKNAELAKEYYRKSLSSSDADVLFRGKIAGRVTTIERSYIEAALSAI